MSGGIAELIQSFFGKKQAAQEPLGVRTNPWGELKVANWSYVIQGRPLEVVLYQLGNTIVDPWALGRRLVDVYGVGFNVGTNPQPKTWDEIISRAKNDSGRLHVGVTDEAFLSTNHAQNIAGQVLSNMVCVTPRLIPVERWTGLVAHEIGHVFGLPHKPGTLMAGDGSGYLLGLDESQRAAVAWVRA